MTEKPTPPPGVKIYDLRKYFYFTYLTPDNNCGGLKLIRVDITSLVKSQEEAQKKAEELMINIKNKGETGQFFNLEETMVFHLKDPDVNEGEIRG